MTDCLSGIDVKQLGLSVQSQLSPKFKSTFGMLEGDGIILYARDTATDPWMFMLQGHLLLRVSISRG